ncbi:MAG TPA: hypothetical protein VFH62_01015 [Dehalococcoidia bacterium]|jgi:hypothetical protein|nr:hypothetical protein [Dehalococcoidia bacterium]
MSRYETFVIRVWVEDPAEVNHGEIRHPLSGAGRRFVRMEEAMAFMDRYIAEERAAAAPVAIDEDARR